MEWTLEKIHLPLKFDWKISRNTSASKTNFIVQVAQAGLTGRGEVAFNVRYGESAELIEEAFARFLRQVGPVEAVDLLNSDFLSTLDLPLSLRFAVESAWVHWQAAKARRPVWEVLGIPPPPEKLVTSFSLPILEVGEIGEFIKTHRLDRFAVLKIKVDQNAVERVKEVAKHYSGPLRVDANEAWRTAEEVLSFMAAVRDLPIQFIEQPLPADLVEEAVELKKSMKRSPVILMADEAVTSGDVTADFQQRYHAVNIKLMKSGGYFQAVRQLRQARELGLQTMLGCMVETSIGIASAFCLAGGVDYFDLDGCLLLKEEPFGWVKEEHGRLQLSASGAAALGAG